MSSCVRVGVEAGRSGTVVSCLSGTEPWRPRILSSGGSSWRARVALVQSRASLLAGDDVSLSLEVGEGAALELVELGAIVCHDARGGAPARVQVLASIAPGGRLIWLGQPMIVAAGAAVSSSVVIDLAPGAVALRGDGVVLGRCGESCGALVTRTRIVRDGVPLLDEELDTGASALRSPVVAGDATMIAAVTLAGTRDEDPPSGSIQAHGPATAGRDVGATVEVAAAAGAVAERWRRLVVDYRSLAFGGGSCEEPDSASAAFSSSQFSAMLPRTDSKIVSP